VDQIFERYVPRQTLVNAPRNVSHLRQLLAQHALALFLVLPCGIGAIASFRHSRSPSLFLVHHGVPECEVPRSAKIAERSGLISV